MMMGRGKSFCCCKKEKNKRQLERCFVGLKDVAERKEEDGGRRGHAYKSNKGEKADLFLLGREMTPSYFSWNHFWASFFLTLWWSPTRDLDRRRLETRFPGRSRTM